LQENVGVAPGSNHEVDLDYRLESTHRISFVLKRSYLQQMIRKLAIARRSA